MNRKLLDLSGTIDPLTVEILTTVERVTARCAIRYFVVGATARDMVLYHAHGIRPGRATMDIDLGVELTDWDGFQALKQGLIDTGLFEATRAAHTLMSRSRIPLDLVPFGALEQPGHQIHWPPDQAIRMSVLGFEDAYNARQMLRLSADPVLDLPFASPTGLALMKFIAWRERSSRQNEDAADLVLIMRHYLDIGHRDRLAREHPALLNVDDFDYELAGTWLLGLDIAGISSPETRSAILEILEQETATSAPGHLAGNMAPHFPAAQDAFAESLRYLETLKSAIEEGGHPAQRSGFPPARE